MRNVTSDNTDIFFSCSVLLEQRDNSNFTQYAVLPHSTQIVIRLEITVTSLRPMYSVTSGRTIDRFKFILWRDVLRINAGRDVRGDSMDRNIAAANLCDH